MTRTARMAVWAMMPAALLAMTAALESGIWAQGKAKPAAKPAQKAAQKPAVEPAGPPVSAEGKRCLGCHNQVTPGVVKDWLGSKHSAMGIDCASCHVEAGKGDRPDAKNHHGFKIAVIVTPKTCEGCHESEAKEFQASRHADAAKFIGSLDNVLGEAVGGGPVADAGCKQCHGSTVAMKDGKVDPATWPNTGIGRINPDGSKGACTSCHSRHAFSVAQARTPEACGKCHLGPDHPQKEVWEESKHGSRYHQALALGGKQGLTDPAGKWLPGKSYSAGPTCASCHMSATPSIPVTHDVGKRISWTLRPAVSTKLPEWEAKRKDMQDVCTQCHSRSTVNGFYTQFDRVVGLYNEKFATPAKAIMDGLTASGKLTGQPFDHKIKWTYYELWHHEGRRARHGAAMAGPDYAWWHGMYEVAKNFYTEFIPEARELDPALVDKVIKGMPEHDWFTKGMSKADLEGVIKFYQGRYAP